MDYEVALPVLVAALALVPLTVLAVAYRRTGSRRVLLSALAFLAFFLKGIVLAWVGTYGADDYVVLEVTEFGADVVILLLFSAALLLPGGAEHA